MKTYTKGVCDNTQLSLPFWAEFVSLFLRSCTIPSKWGNKHSMSCKFSGCHSRHCSKKGSSGYYTEQDKSILTIQTKWLPQSSGWLNPYINDAFLPDSVSIHLNQIQSPDGGNTFLSKTPKQSYYSTHCNNAKDLHYHVWNLYKTIHHSMQKWLLAWFTIMQQFKHRNVFRTKYHIREWGLKFWTYDSHTPHLNWCAASVHTVLVNSLQIPHQVSRTIRPASFPSCHTECLPCWSNCNCPFPHTRQSSCN